MASRSDVIVIGGGVIGLTAAYFLARAGVSVRVIDQRDFGREASWAGAGILPPGKPEAALTAFDRLLCLGSAQFPELSAELRQQTGLDNGYVRCGGLECATEGLVAPTEEWGRLCVLFEELSPAQVQRLEPEVSPPAWPVYYLPEMAQVRNPRHLKALVAACAKMGVMLSPACPVFRLEVKADSVRAVETGAGRLLADRFVIAAGAWTDLLVASLQNWSGIRPLRGQIALLNPGRPLFSRIIMHGKHYLVPRADGRVLVGSTEEDAGFDKRTTAVAISDLLRFAVATLPALAQAVVERTWAGLRPASHDGKPFIGPLPNLNNVLVAAGHGRAGIQLSPSTAVLVTDWALRRKPSIEMEDFSLLRVPTLTPAAATST